MPIEIAPGSAGCRSGGAAAGVVHPKCSTYDEGKRGGVDELITVSAVATSVRQ